MQPSDYLVAFLLTVLIEISVSLALGYRNRDALKMVVLVNLATHPAFNYLLGLAAFLGFVSTNLVALSLLEIAVVLVEWKLLEYGLDQKSKSLLILSASMNACSYLAGLLILSLA